jgi:hypothetical protein
MKGEPFFQPGKKARNVITGINAVKKGRTCSRFCPFKNTPFAKAAKR